MIDLKEARELANNLECGEAADILRDMAAEIERLEDELTGAKRRLGYFTRVFPV